MPLYMVALKGSEILASDKKLIEKFQKEPLPKDIALDDLIRYLELYGFEIIKNRGKGSHCIAKHKNLDRPFTIPSKNGKTVSFVYLKELNRIIKKMEE